MASVPSSADDRKEGTSECVEGEIIKTEGDEIKGEKAIEICLTEKEGEKGEEQHLILREEVIKGGGEE